MMTRNAANQLRTMIHMAEVSAREERVSLICEHARTVETVTRVNQIERERALASVACVLIWEVQDAPHGHSDPAIKLWRALRRAASINFQRWAPVMIICEKIFRKNLLTATAV